MTTPPGSVIRLGGGRSALTTRLRRLAWVALLVLAGLSGLLGIGMVWFHLSTDPLADVLAYYEAARRLNAGQPLYFADADPARLPFYLYPPLLAIVLRPLAALGFQVFTAAWAALVLVSFLLLLRRLGANRRAFVVVGLLGMPVGWALAVAQAHIPLTLLLAIGQPWSLALAANIKVFPVLAAVWWLGRRNFQAFRALVGWMLILGVFQWIMEPAGSVAFFSSVGLEQVAGIRNLSPYAISPILWIALLGAGGVGALLLAPTRWGWAAAVGLATLASPRLLVYMLTGLLAALREPDPPRAGSPDPHVPDAVEANGSSAR